MRENSSSSLKFKVRIVQIISLDDMQFSFLMHFKIFDILWH